MSTWKSMPMNFMWNGNAEFLYDWLVTQAYSGTRIDEDSGLIDTQGNDRKANSLHATVITYYLTHNSLQNGAFNHLSYN